MQKTECAVVGRDVGWARGTGAGCRARLRRLRQPRDTVATRVRSRVAAECLCAKARRLTGLLTARAEHRCRATEQRRGHALPTAHPTVNAVTSEAKRPAGLDRGREHARNAWRA